MPVGLIPQFGITPGVNPTGTGDCDGVNGQDGKPIKIPCHCPPSRKDFIEVKFFNRLLMLCIVYLYNCSY